MKGEAGRQIELLQSAEGEAHGLNHSTIRFPMKPDGCKSEQSGAQAFGFRVAVVPAAVEQVIQNPLDDLSRLDVQHDPLIVRFNSSSGPGNVLRERMDSSKCLARVLPCGPVPVDEHWPAWSDSGAGDEVPVGNGGEVVEGLAEGREPRTTVIFSGPQEQGPELRRTG